MTDFAELVTTESRGLVAAVTAIVGDRSRAEEIVQEAFERCYRRWRRVSRLDRPGAWVRRVAINEAISVARRASTEARVLQRVGTLAGPGSDGSSPDPLAALDDEGVWAAVRALPKEQAAAIALRYGADLGVEDVADALGSTVPAVKSLLHRGRTALRTSPVMQAYAE
jgi:RNA polymerase sigma factor (sigma-70 family)